jgi:hypothetical protein
VHGLGGDPLTTWRSGEDESSSWPHWLAEDKEFGARIGVWSLGHATVNPLQRPRLKKPFLSKTDPEAGTAMPLPMRAVNALDRLAREGIGYRPVCFITHSLGGLLVKSILSQAGRMRLPTLRTGGGWRNNAAACCSWPRRITAPGWRIW